MAINRNKVTTNKPPIGAKMKLQVSLIKLMHSDKLTTTAKKWAINNWQYLSQTNTPLINVNSSAKVVKGEKLNVYTGVLYLKPADSVAKQTICPAAGKAGCKAGCLETSGLLGMKIGDNAKIKRTICYLLETERFGIELRKEINKHYKKHSEALTIRLNGTSDIDFSALIASMPYIQFYDYTKIYYRVKNNRLKNYDLTYSGSANNDLVIKHTARAIRDGKRVVLAMNTAETKGEWKRPQLIGDIPLVDMDETDVRFKDAANAIGTLKRKGSSKTERKADSTKNGFFFNESTFNQLVAML